MGHAIHLHVNRVVYLCRIKQGVERIGLDGKSCGQIVDAEAVDFAKEKAKELSEHYKLRNKTNTSKELISQTSPIVKPIPDIERGGRAILKLKKTVKEEVEACNVNIYTRVNIYICTELSYTLFIDN